LNGHLFEKKCHCGVICHCGVHHYPEGVVGPRLLIL
jgi:hypothetical protein